MDAASLFRDHHRDLCRYLLRFTGDADLAADAAQEAFVRVLERPPHTADRAKSWLYTVATNVARETARTRTRRRRILQGAPDRAPVGDPPPAPDATLEADQRRAVVQRALLTLSDRERTAVLMREQGFAQREIADALGTTTATVGSLIVRTLQKLADRIGADTGVL